MPNRGTLRYFISTVAGVAGTVISMSTGYPAPLGILVSSLMLFRDLVKRDPFRISEEELRRLIRQAREVEEECEKELSELRRIKSRVERGEIAGDITSLEMRIKQLEEQCKMARTKKNIVEVVLLVKENIEAFKKLLGDRGFNELVANMDNIKKRVKEELEKAGIRELDLEQVTSYLRNLIPLIIKEPEKVLEETVLEEREPKAKQAERPGLTLTQLENLLNEGSMEQWIELLKKLVNEKQKIKLPPGKHFEKKGYKNLLKALYVLGIDASTLRGVIEDRVLSRFAEYITLLREGKTIEADVNSSDIGYLDDMLTIMSDKYEDRVKDGTKMRTYVFSVPGSGQVIIERTVIKDPVTGKAVRVSFKGVPARGRSTEP